MTRLVDIENLTEPLIKDNYECEVFDYGVGTSYFADNEIVVKTKIMFHTSPTVRYFDFHIKYNSASISKELQEIFDCMGIMQYYGVHEKIQAYLNKWYCGKIYLGNGEWINISEDVFIYDYVLKSL